MQFKMINQEDKCVKRFAQRIGQAVRGFMSFVVLIAFFGGKYARVEF